MKSFKIAMSGTALALTLGAVAYIGSRAPKMQTTEFASHSRLYSQSGLRAVSEILGSDSPLKPYRHPMQVRFYVNGDQDYLGKKAKEALNQALLETLNGDVSEEGLIKALGANVQDAVLDKFVKTLRVYKLINTGLQMDLLFIPQENSIRDLGPQLSSNQLVRLSETGRLDKILTDLQSQTVIGNLYRYSSLVPSVSGGGVTYLGGAVSLFVEVLDTGFKIKIPNPLKNGVKGFVRYRRYYRVDENRADSFSCGDYKVSKTIEKNGIPLFYTVDLYKNFNLENLIPTDETIEIYPGLLVATGEGRSELLPDSTKETGKSVIAASISVEKTSNQKTKFRVRKLVYEPESKRLDLDRSLSALVPVRADSSKRPHEKRPNMYHEQKKFLTSCAQQLENNLAVSAFLQEKL